MAYRYRENYPEREPRLPLFLPAPPSAPSPVGLTSSMGHGMPKKMLAAKFQAESEKMLLARGWEGTPDRAARSPKRMVGWDPSLPDRLYGKEPFSVYLRFEGDSGRFLDLGDQG